VTTEWQYDANGNRTHENGNRIASYDDEERLLTFKGATCQYNGAGDLSAKQKNDQTTNYIYDSLEIIMNEKYKIFLRVILFLLGVSFFIVGLTAFTVGPSLGSKMSEISMIGTGLFFIYWSFSGKTPFK